MKRKAYTSISLFIPLNGEKGETSVCISGGNKFLHSVPNRIPGQTEIGKLEIGLLEHGAKVVKTDGKRFVRTRDEIAPYSSTEYRRCLRYKVESL